MLILKNKRVAAICIHALFFLPPNRGGRIYVIEFSRTVTIVHGLLNEGWEGQRPDYLQAVKATRPELQVNVKAVFLQLTFDWLVSGKFFGFDTVEITLV